MRAARHEDAFYYDLTDPAWCAIRVTHAGWQIVDKPPILFKRFSHQAAQVEPISGGEIRRVFDFICVPDEAG